MKETSTEIFVIAGPPPGCQSLANLLVRVNTGKPPGRSIWRLDGRTLRSLCDNFGSTGNACSLYSVFLRITCG